MGAVFNEKNDYIQKMRSRLGKVRTVFNKMHKLFYSGDLSLTLKIRMLICYVFSFLPYDMEAWTLNKNVTDWIGERSRCGLIEEINGKLDR